MTCSTPWLPTMLLKNVRLFPDSRWFGESDMHRWRITLSYLCTLLWSSPSVCVCYSRAARGTSCSCTEHSRPLPDIAGCWWWCLPAVPPHPAGERLWLSVGFPYQRRAHWKTCMVWTLLLTFAIKSSSSFSFRRKSLLPTVVRLSHPSLAPHKVKVIFLLSIICFPTYS